VDRGLACDATKKKLEPGVRKWELYVASDWRRCKKFFQILLTTLGAVI
jgi:hypothetical protein